MRTTAPPQHPVLTWSENELQASTIQTAKALGWFTYHTHDSRRSDPGCPDLVLWHPGQGRVLFRELKTETGKTSPNQETVIKALSRSGADVAVWRPRHWISQSIIRDLKGAPVA